MHENLVSLLSQLVAFRSVDGRIDDKRAAAAFVRDWLDANGVTVTWHDHPLHPAIIADIPGTGDPLLFLTHIDVVPAPDTLFAMRRDGDIVYGRGVQDDKGPTAMLMLLLAAIAKETQPHAAIRAVITTDEEIGSTDGVARLVKEGRIGNPRCVIALDGGDEDEIVLREKGCLHLTLQAVGKTAHNSTPWKGDNAIEKIIRTYQRLKESLHTETTETDRWHTTVSIGTIDGGQFVNQVPGSATAKIDIRFTDPMTEAQAVKAVESCLEPGVSILGYTGGEPFETRPDDPLAALYAECMRESLGARPAFVSEHGATDARFFRGLGVPIWIHYPKGGDIHTDDEWMDVGSAAKLLDGLTDFVRKAA